MVFSYDDGQLRVTLTDDPPRVTVYGTVDLSNVAFFGCLLGTAGRLWAGDLVVDVGGLEFIDVGGLRVLAALALTEHARDRRLVLLRASPYLRHLLTMADWHATPGLELADAPGDPPAPP
ncbi:STAS domain-containing protein [Bailinhaonella thermotolerans]|nr:STAS domain-containing protein [Bailinhaonella thermotolerans]